MIYTITHFLPPFFGFFASYYYLSLFYYFAFYMLAIFASMAVLVFSISEAIYAFYDFISPISCLRACCSEVSGVSAPKYCSNMWSASSFGMLSSCCCLFLSPKRTG